MEFLAILCGLGGFFITWKTYHWFWSLADRVHESGYSYFMKRAGMSVVVGLLSYVFLSPDFQSSASVSPTNHGNSIEFNKGDILAIISDGLAEAPNAKGELFDYPQIQSIITENSHLNAKTLIDELMSQTDIWLAGAHNPDDITIVIIKHD